MIPKPEAHDEVLLVLILEFDHFGFLSLPTRSAEPSGLRESHGCSDEGAKKAIRIEYLNFSYRSNGRR